MSEPLKDLASLYGVATEYDDATGKRVEASEESLLAVLSALGAPVEKTKDAASALRERTLARWRRPVEPVVVSWNGVPPTIDLRLPAKNLPGSVRASLETEEGEQRSWDLSLADPSEARTETVEGVGYVTKRVKPPERLTLGYHRLTLDLPGGPAETLVIAAPTRAYSPKGRGWERTWGVFLPLYSLRSERSLGAGDFGDLEALTEWAQELGAGVVGTLPLLAAFLDEPYEISPYSPVSRLLWNEFYIDLDRVPEVAASPAARAILESPDFAAARGELRSAPLVDYRRVAALKRRVLEEAARAFFATSSDRRAAVDRYAGEHPYAADYAAFRAAGEWLRKPWSDWPEALRAGTIAAGHYDEDAKRYHLFAQWVADEQLGAISEKARGGGFGLYLDLPLGVHAAGYDTWRERESFALGVAGGAPPDPAFPRGQNWGFVPLHPEGIRETGYRYVRAFLTHQLRHAGVLRIDHMPSFHRVYWIPPGGDPRHGAYVRYPAEELYAVFSLESHRHRTLLVGEDLGTVPPEVPVAMTRYNVHRMSVVEYELKPDPVAALTDPPAASLACVNTHDMPPFAAFWQGTDVIERVELGLINEEAAAKETTARDELRAALTTFLESDGLLAGEADAGTVLRALLSHLRDGPARVLLVNLEDLWSETEPQNVPSTAGEESLNWRRKARYSLEEFSRMPEVLEALREVARGVSASP